MNFHPTLCLVLAVAEMMATVAVVVAAVVAAATMAITIKATVTTQITMTRITPVTAVATIKVLPFR